MVAGHQQHQLLPTMPFALHHFVGIFQGHENMLTTQTVPDPAFVVFCTQLKKDNFASRMYFCPLIFIILS